MRRGQVALYLLVVLVGIALMMLMNVGVFISVRERNKMMNAADAAAIASAGVQRDLLNRIGEINVERLKIAVGMKGGDDASNFVKLHELVLEQMRLCFLGPLEAIPTSSEWAKKNGIERSDGMVDIFKTHINDIRTLFVNNPELFQPPYDVVTGDIAEGCDWQTYSERMESFLPSMVAGPDNAEFVDEIRSPPLLDPGFYDAIAGACWCWFKVNNQQAVFNYSSLALQNQQLVRKGVQWNCEVYPLHLRFDAWHGFDEEWTNTIMKITGCSADDIAGSTLITNQQVVWAFYDSTWRKWSELSVERNFPVIGALKPEYDVKGCIAQSRVMDCYNSFFGVEGEDESGETMETSFEAAAKPFGTVETIDGEEGCVTELMNFVTPCFTRVKLVPVVAQGNEPRTSDPAWMGHVRHIRDGVRDGGCWYCRTLEKWDDARYRDRGREWLNCNGGNCVIPSDSYGGFGGNGYAH